MKTTVSTKGQIILPAEIRQRDGIESGQEFEVERIDRGEYRLKRKERRRNEGLVKLLLACPVKGWFKPMDRKETTNDVKLQYQRSSIFTLCAHNVSPSSSQEQTE
jgi:AbrB family looped-hinge helix DNA binding protein